MAGLEAYFSNNSAVWVLQYALAVNSHITAVGWLEHDSFISHTR